ncbi:hypothetical protein GGI07_002195 [Coemansia sp. Benny D115]|nr:hypothetical protein GGI07_002195 [Coemansia sp. Benny D115]
MFSASILFVIALAALAHACWAMNITCAGFMSLPKLTYDNAQPQALTQVIIAFEPNTSSQIIDAYRDALTCRGSTMKPPNYNTQTLVGYVSEVYAQKLDGSANVAAVEYDSALSALQSTGSSSGHLVTALASSSQLTTGSGVSDENMDAFLTNTHTATRASDSSSGASGLLWKTAASQSVLALALHLGYRLLQ